MRQRVNGWRVVVVAAILVLTLGGPALAQCSSSTVRGTWAFQGQGTALMTVPGSPMPVPMPFVSLGTMRIDWQGRYTGQGTISVGGQVQDMGFSGSIQVNPDCTAVEAGSVGPLQTAGRLVILDNGNEMRELPTTHPLGPVIELAYFRRLSWGEPHCQSETVRGVYQGSGAGTFMVQVPGQPQPVPSPFAGLFTMNFDGDGTGSGVASASLAGSLADVEFPEISMKVNHDCTATLEYKGSVKQAPGQVFSGTIKYIVLAHGNELLGMEVVSSIGLPIELESHRRIAMRPLPPR
jgi:hypothetical protein